MTAFRLCRDGPRLAVGLAKPCACCAFSYPAIALLIAHYNFCRVHESLCVTPAMEFGLTNHIWDIAELMQTAEATPMDIEPLPQPSAYLRPGRQPFQLRVIRGGKMG